MDWYRGPTLLEHLEQVEVAPAADAGAPFRMPVQWVNRPHAQFRGYSGLIAGGEVTTGMPVQIWPSGRMVHIDSIVTPGGDADLARAGESVTLTFEEEVDASRGDLLAETGAPPLVGDRLSVRLVSMAEERLAPGRTCLLKVGTCTANARIEPLLQVFDLDSRAAKPSREIANNEIGTCVLQLDRPVPVDRYGENRATGSFILIDPESYDTIAIGIVEAVSGTRGQTAETTALGRHADGSARARETHVRSAAKALTWRIIGSFAAFLVALALTGNYSFAGLLAAVDIVVHTILYYWHERMWSKIAWGTR